MAGAIITVVAQTAVGAITLPQGNQVVGRSVHHSVLIDERWTRKCEPRRDVLHGVQQLWNEEPKELQIL
jgi:hypothetical protein